MSQLHLTNSNTGYHSKFRYVHTHRTEICDLYFRLVCVCVWGGGGGYSICYKLGSDDRVMAIHYSLRYRYSCLCECRSGGGRVCKFNCIDVPRQLIEAEWAWQTVQMPRSHDMASIQWHIREKDQQGAHFLNNLFHLIYPRHVSNKYLFIFRSSVQGAYSISPCIERGV
jgi:hypothetical protein